MTKIRCPHCGQIIDQEPEPAITLEALADYCREHNLPVYQPGARVSESTAARLLGKAVGTVRNWRYGSRPLTPIRTGAGRGRITYKLADISDFIRLER